MPNSLFGSILGSAQSYSTSASQLQNGYNPQMGMNQQYANQLAAQNALSNQYAQAQQRAFEAPKWVIDGRTMSIQDFANELFGDTPERTMFLLKYLGENK